MKTQSEYEAKIITPEQCFKILMAMRQPERTLTLLIAATGASDFRMPWFAVADVDYDNQQVFVRRSWTGGRWVSLARRALWLPFHWSRYSQASFAAVKAGVLKEGEKVRFGFHSLRHSLASFLVRKGTDVKTVQKMLRHSDVTHHTWIYAHSMSEDRLAAQDDMLAAMMTPSNAVKSTHHERETQRSHTARSLPYNSSLVHFALSTRVRWL